MLYFRCSPEREHADFSLTMYNKHTMTTNSTPTFKVLPGILLKYLTDHFTCFTHLTNGSDASGSHAALNGNDTAVFNGSDVALNATTPTPHNLKEQQEAFVYIVAVLGFYSFGVIIMMIKFLQRERTDLEEEQMLEEFLKALKKSRQQPRRGRLPLRTNSLKLPGRLARSRGSLPSISFNLVTLSKKRPSLMPSKFTGSLEVWSDENGIIEKLIMKTRLPAIKPQ